MSDEEFAQRYRLMQRYVSWCDEDARRVAVLWPLVAPHAETLIADFYAEIRRHPQAIQVISGGSEQIKRLSQSLHRWLTELLAGVYDDDYMARRWKVGYRHVEIGLAQRFTSLALSRLRAGIVRSVEIEWRASPELLAASLQSFHKLVDLEHALIQDAYEYEHVRRERKLERDRGERKFRHLVESASCLIVILGPDRSVVYFNPFSERAAGCRFADLPEEDDGVLSILGSDKDETIGRLNAVLAGEGPIAYQVQIPDRNGPPQWFNWTLSRMNDFDEGVAVLAVGHDVTEQKRTAQELLQANRLATIGEMYARLTHESRNALQRLRVCTEMLADEVNDRPPAMELLNRAQRAQEDLQRLLDEVRNFASPMTLECTECRLPALWREAWSLLQVSRQGRAAELNEIASISTRPIQVDRFRLVQAFRNIFENSLAACADSAVVNIQCKEAVIECEPAIEVVIEDNGPGFGDTALQQAFEPFFTTKSAGTGLGLAIVRRIVEAHGGRIEASRADLGGARLRFVLPYRTPRT